MPKINVRRMVPKDFEFAIKLTNTSKWNLEIEDFRRTLDLEPKGCFIAEVDRRRVGLLTTVVYDSLAWIGNVIIDESSRGKGFGVKLMKHALKFLKVRKARTIGLYAYEDTAGFYEKLGFVSESRFLRCHAKVDSIKPSIHARRMERSDLSRVISIDGKCMRASRKRMLERWYSDFQQGSFITGHSDRPIGFAISIPTVESVDVGPWICKPQYPENASDLLKAIMNQFVGKQVNVGIRKKNKVAKQVLDELNFEVDFEVHRMYFEGVSQKFGGCLMGIESLERG